MRHVGSHVNGPQTGSDCFLNQESPEAILPLPTHEPLLEEGGAVPTPAILRTDTDGEQVLVPENAQSPVLEAVSNQLETIPPVDTSDGPQQQITEPDGKKL